MKKNITLFLICILLSACGATNKKVITETCSLTSTGPEPEWINSPVPELNGFYYAYGVAEAKNITFVQARKNSHNDARNELAASLQSKITSSFLENTTLTKKAGVNLLNQTLERNMKSQSNLFLSKAFIEKTWNDPKSCLVWSKIRLNKNDYFSSKAVIDKSIQADIVAELAGMNAKLDTTNKLLENVKKETSNNPRKELMNRGISFSGKEFGKAIMRADTEVMKLFLDGGLSFKDAYDNDYIVPLEHRLVNLPLKYLEKILLLFKQYPDQAPNIRSRYLQHAAFIGSLAHVDLLLKYGADAKALYSGNIDIGSMDSNAFRLDNASAECVAKMMQGKAEESPKLDAKRWQEISKRLAPYAAPSKGKVMLAKSIVAYDTYQCNQAQVKQAASLANQRAKSCKQYFAKKSDESLFQKQNDINIGLTSQANTVFESATQQVLPKLASGSFSSTDDYFKELRHQLKSTCESHKDVLCGKVQNNDFPYCRN